MAFLQQQIKTCKENEKRKTLFFILGVALASLIGGAPLLTGSNLLVVWAGFSTLS
jgi:hypothetical protein